MYVEFFGQANEQMLQVHVHQHIIADVSEEEHGFQKDAVCMRTLYALEEATSPHALVCPRRRNNVLFSAPRDRELII